MKLHRALLAVAALAWLSPAFGAQVSDVPSRQAPVSVPSIQALVSVPSIQAPVGVPSIQAPIGVPTLPGQTATVSPLAAVSDAELAAIAAKNPTPSALAAHRQAAAIVEAAVYAYAHHPDAPSFTRLSLAALRAVMRAQGAVGAKAARSAAIAQLREWLAAPAGMSLGQDDHGAFVEAVRSGGPAAEIGLHPGLRVVALNGEATRGMSRRRLAEHLDRAQLAGVETVLVGSGPDGRTAQKLTSLPLGRDAWIAFFAAHLNRLPAARIQSAAAAALSSLAARLDPFTRYFAPAEGARFQQQLTEQKSEGYGLVFERDDARAIAAVQDGSPAAAVGLRRGDRIVSANGVPLDGSFETTSKAFAAGPEARLSLRRGGEDRAVVLTPASFTRSSVQAQRLKGDVAYFNIWSFTAGTGQDFARAYSELARGGRLRAAVIDLRGNLGGEMAGALTVASGFLPAGRVVVRERTRQGPRDYVTQTDGPLAGIPLAVLIDEDSASASELLAVALKDNDAAVIVGRPSFGKAIGQRFHPLTNGGILSLTIRSVEGARGTRVDRPVRGLQPDVRVRQSAAGRRASIEQAQSAAFGAPIDPAADAELLAALKALHVAVAPAR